MARRTLQRRAILRALRDAPGPLTPQEVHRRARGEHEGLGLATVYRNIARLEDEGDLVAVYLPNEVTRYEPAGRGHHHHFRCLGCERVFELDAECPVDGLRGTTLPGGFTVEDHDLVLYGRCAGCRARPPGGPTEGSPLS